MKVRGSHASPLSNPVGDTFPDYPLHPPRRITYRSLGNADPFPKAPNAPYDASHRRKRHARRQPSSVGSDIRTINDHSPLASTKHMIPKPRISVPYNTDGDPQSITQQRISKGFSQPERRDVRHSNIKPVSSAGLYDQVTTSKETRASVPPKVPEVPRLPTPDLESSDEAETCFCSCCPSPARDVWHDRHDVTDAESKWNAQREYR